MKNDLVQTVLLEDKAKTEAYLQNLCETVPAFAPLKQPDIHCLFEAEQYSLLAGGKRIRPALVLECCQMLGGAKEDALPAAAAIEMIHTYSLIHDDLPCMDNDELRRGKPTCHKAFGETVAVLAGDGLQSDAYYVLASAPRLSAQTRVRLLEVLSLAAGSVGMVGGQLMDTCAEKEKQPIDRETLTVLQARKTGALFRAAVLMGAVVAGVPASDEPDSTWHRLDLYAQYIGKAFQMADDVLDVTSTPEELGKSIGKDQKEKKITALTFATKDEVESEIIELTNKACLAIEPLAGHEVLTALAKQLAIRKN